MSQETFTLTVLPVSVSPSRGFHVSLHIGPTLEPDGGKSTTLGAVLAGTTDAVFPIFKDWPKYLRSARIELLNEAGKTIGAAALLDQMDDALWAKVFPSSTPVRVPVTDTFDQRRWDTFAVKDVHDAARAINLISLAESPVDPAKPFGSQIGRAMLQEVMGDLADKLAGSEEGLRFIGDYLDGKGRNSRLYDESEFARQLDTFIQRYTNGNGAVKQGQSPTFQTLLAQLHQARRFYERPDLMAKYQEEPGNERGWQPEVPDPDFHERVAHLSDVPELLRKLGLVIDLNVTDLAALGKAQSLQARIVRASRVAPGRVLLPQALDPNQSMITPVIRSGDNLLAKPAGDDLLAGRLRLGDTQRYATMVVDADGSGLKLDRFLWSVPRLVRLESYGEPANVAPPSLRAEGFTIARNDKLQAVQTQVQRARDHVAARNARKPVTLSAEDITRGYRIEVWDDTAAKWFGLHERLIDVQVKGAGLVFEGLRTTGQIGGSAVTEAPGVDNPNLKLHEAVFGWSGWSLSAPRPGPRIRHEDGREIVEDADSDPSGVTPVTIKPRVAPGTLPRLRYGRSYAFRAWSVDIAGNSPPHAPVVGGIDPG
ncbi:MAG: hypothetical protein LBE59_03090, partial [Nevskiaceae bacterium]|nr:hypothetical protein [Nevskiaceae bacterium]